jgi:hypothetical protein
MEKSSDYLKIINEKYGTKFKTKSEYAKFVRSKYVKKANKQISSNTCNPVPNISSYSDDFQDPCIVYHQHCF